MPSVKTFNDSAAISVAYAINDGTVVGDLSGVDFNYFPYTTEGLRMNKTTVVSKAITDSRRPRNAKNTRGEASGSVGLEFGFAPFIKDMLQVAMLGTWTQIDSGDVGAGYYITDSDTPQYIAMEKTVKSGPATTDTLYHEQYFANAVNDMSIDFAADLMSMTINTLGMNAATSEAVAGVSGLGGSMCNSKAAPSAYEIADGPNNITSLVVKDSGGTPITGATFSALSMQVQNNARIQTSVDSEYGAGMAFGKVNVMLDGEIYFVDQTILDAHLNSERLSASMVVATAEGTFTFLFPRLLAQAPENNATGENQDYKSSISFSAEEGTVLAADIGGDATDTDCLVLIKYVPV